MYQVSALPPTDLHKETNTRRTNMKLAKTLKMAATVTAATSALAFAGSSTVNADSFGQHDGNSGRVADNSTHTYCRTAAITGNSNAVSGVSHAMSNLNSGTVMSTNGPLGCTTFTDVVWGRTFDGGVDGTSVCEDIKSDGTCESASADINFDNMSGLNDWKQTSCHEVGHTVGLNHNVSNGQDCMGSDPAFQFYSQHHKDHVSDEYS